MMVRYTVITIPRERKLPIHAIQNTYIEIFGIQVIFGIPQGVWHPGHKIKGGQDMGISIGFGPAAIPGLSQELFGVLGVGRRRMKWQYRKFGGRKRKSLEQFGRVGRLLQDKGTRRDGVVVDFRQLDLMFQNVRDLVHIWNQVSRNPRGWQLGGTTSASRNACTDRHGQQRTLLNQFIGLQSQQIRTMQVQNRRSLVRHILQKGGIRRHATLRVESLWRRGHGGGRLFLHLLSRSFPTTRKKQAELFRVL
jgi:hypothetical protein